MNTENAACGPEAVFDEPYYREVYDRATGRPVGQEAALQPADRPPAVRLETTMGRPETTADRARCSTATVL